MATPPPSPPDRDFWTAERVTQALGVAASHGAARAEPFGRVWTDTRSVEPGDLFVALAGERFDAHDFVGAAVGAGAAGMVVSRASAAAALEVPVFVVPDTLTALGALAHYRRASLARVVGVVGTNGKTSTKELLRAALGSTLRVHATTGNLNNLIGVPLTLLACPLDSEAAVIEMGTNQPGEVARLRGIVAPDIAVVTSIAEEHLEGLGDVEGVLREEMAACDGVPVAVVPAVQPEVVAAARERATRVVAAGLESGDLRAESWRIDAGGQGHLRVNGVDIHVPVRGVHNLRNAMLALAVARECGVPLADAARGIAEMTLPPMRVHVEQHGAATVINDAYNANPGSARAAIELLVHAGAGRQRVAVLGSMLELGPRTPELHDEVARAALDAGVEVVAGMGEFAQALARVAPGDARVVAAPDVARLWAALSSRLQADAVILLKGSRGMKLEQLLAPIAEWASARSAR
jgi:UDP-N-acetylmuramoyl-tripeptide--D-alanyl-D-alanine ligase